MKLQFAQKVITTESMVIFHKRLKFSGARCLCVWSMKTRKQRASSVPVTIYILRFIRKLLKYEGTSKSFRTLFF